jgi:gentisate 1,2-dioxygenase
MNRPSPRPSPKGEADPREAFYARIDPHHMAPLWTRLKALVPREPTAMAAAHRWHYGDLRPFVLESAAHISAEEAERRVLILENPALRGSSQVTGTLYAGLQLIMPGETAPAHRHTQSALRFIMEGGGAYTTVDDRKVLMEPGDLVITPPWRWHLHGNESARPMVWLDGLDIPLAMYFGGTFREDGHERSTATPEARPLGPIHFPYAEARKALGAMARGEPDPHRGFVHRYLDPATGDWAMPTIATSLRFLPAGFATRPMQCSDSAVLVVVEGHGTARVGEREFDLSPHDILVVPGWQSHALGASEDLVVFAYSDRAAQEKLGFFRERRL